MKKKEKIITVWNEADEIREDLALSDDEIIVMLPSIRGRIKTICELLQDEFTTEEYNKLYPRGK